jgi:hypothetical protein
VKLSAEAMPLTMQSRAPRMGWRVRGASAAEYHLVDQFPMTQQTGVMDWREGMTQSRRTVSVRGQFGKTEY